MGTNRPLWLWVSRHSDVLWWGKDVFVEAIITKKSMQVKSFCQHTPPMVAASKYGQFYLRKRKARP